MIIKDLVDLRLAEATKLLLDVILPKNESGYRQYLSSLTAVCKCQYCSKELALVLDKNMIGYEHILLQPATRVVIGIDPEIRDRLQNELGMNIAFGHGDARYYCSDCDKGKILKDLASADPLIKEGILFMKDPIIDQRGFNPRLGCFITLTEFFFDKKGRYLNRQTDFNNLVRIAYEADLVSYDLLEPFLELKTKKK